MGHYCYVCGEKLIGGIKPRCCYGEGFKVCIESMCYGCWERQFKGNMSVELQERIKECLIEKRKLSNELKQELLDWANRSEVVKCLACGASIKIDDHVPYNYRADDI